MAISLTRFTKKLSKLPPERLHLFIVAIACLILAGAIILQAVRTQKNQQYYTATSWSSQTAQSFFDGCTYVAKRPDGGVSTRAADIYCGCDIDGLQAIYKNENDLLQEEKNWVKNGYPPEVLSVMHACASKAHVPLNI